jgi:hypothetical protein
MTGDSHWLGYGSLVSTAGGLWGMASNMMSSDTLAVLTPDSLPPLLAIAAGVAMGITWQFRKMRESDVQEKFTSLEFALGQAQSLYRSEVTDHDQTRRLMVAWKKAAMSAGIEIDERAITRVVERAVAVATGDTTGSSDHAVL